jgi:hypothetical protein
LKNAGNAATVNHAPGSQDVTPMKKSLALAALTVLLIVSRPTDTVAAGQRHRQRPSPPEPSASVTDPACEVKDIQKTSTIAENMAKSPVSDLVAITQMDANNIHQLYVRSGNGDAKCLTCTARPGGPRVDREKMMVSFHPSGQWIAVGIEEDKHENQWLPKSLQRGLLQGGIWLNIWLTTPTGDRWYQMTDFKNSGYVGVAFTPDGKKAVWAEIVDGNILVHLFGVWKLYAADFQISKDGTPSLANRREITPKGAIWLEPGNFAPDNRHMLLSSDIGLRDPQGQDQWSLDVETGALKNLTNSPTSWDEHGVYSPSGKKITFMSSYPYRNEPNAYKTVSLKTEFMLMDADGSQLQQLTHFNMPGYPESQPERTVAAVAQFFGDGSQMFAFVMGKDFTKTNWILTFKGRCGG